MLNKLFSFFSKSYKNKVAFTFIPEYINEVCYCKYCDAELNYRGLCSNCDDEIYIDHKDFNKFEEVTYLV